MTASFTENNAVLLRELFPVSFSNLKPLWYQGYMFKNLLYSRAKWCIHNIKQFKLGWMNCSVISKWATVRFGSILSVLNQRSMDKVVVVSP